MYNYRRPWIIIHWAAIIIHRAKKNFDWVVYEITMKLEFNMAKEIIFLHINRLSVESNYYFIMISKPECVRICTYTQQRKTSLLATKDARFVSKDLYRVKVTTELE